MFRLAGLACLGFCAFIAVLSLTGAADHIAKPVPAIVAFAIAGITCLWLAAKNRHLRG